MNIFIGRQPIFSADNEVFAYELLYRDNSQSNKAVIADASQATKILVSDAINIFNIKKLTDCRKAFINFNKELIINGFIKVLDPEDVVVELLEDIKYDDEMVDSLIELRKLGYNFAVDDFDGRKDISKALPFVSTIKVDFLMTDEETQKAIADRYKNSGKTLLAEKVESMEIFNKAKDWGYQLFQGYYFAKPSIIEEKYVDNSVQNYMRIMSYVVKNNYDFKRIAQIIRTDAVLSYRLIKKMNTIDYFRGVPIKDIEMALIRMGEDNFRRWISLMVVRGINNKSEELLKLAYLRARMIEELMKISKKVFIASQASNGFLVGMFSLMPSITDTNINILLDDVHISDDAYDALSNPECDNALASYLKLVIEYENGDTDGIGKLLDKFDISEKKLVDIYIKCLEESDEIYTFDKI